MSYKPTIGLEIHVELATKTKMFCRCKNDSTTGEKKPNVNICPVCTAQPGALPVINKEAVHHVLRAGVAMGGTVADFTEFDRKNYFYPDIPKGYQISQYKYPLISGGNLNGVELTRIHLEEDTAKSSHESDHSLIDFNRSSLPLMELVTEPVIHDGKTASAFAKELQLLLRYLGASEANMEKGQMRLEANISVSKTNDLGTKVEVKNLNSFKSVEKAIDFEIARQIKQLEKGDGVVQETRGWDENKQITFSQRLKESSHDYRYFPDPDLPKLFLSEILEFTPEAIKKSLPQLPWEKRAHFTENFGLKSEDVEVFVADHRLAKFFTEVAEGFDLTLETAKFYLQTAANYITSDILGLSASTGELRLPESKAYVDLIKMVGEKEISSRGAKDILDIMIKEGGEPRAIAEARGLLQVHDEGAISLVVDEVIAKNESVFAEFKGGKEKSLMFLIGQAMKESKGSANPEILKKLFEEKVKN
ncbi:MAG: Asp-tRNA(Asn)/Glu-tRNA(Gln) amidotransferase subunit GatB [Candidatus Vogelbacteria bacterium]|nr:Asp-tRNA(Asn)/Glu-tRNA(Gln) amidotransferase subunit GatB [Candidatus Vogelbacteria bacterium]